MSCLELSVTLPITYTLCVQRCTCNYDEFVTSTCFRIRVNINLVNTTVQSKGNMPAHLYHGNINYFLVDLMYIFDIYIPSNRSIHDSLLGYLSVYYMNSC